jgi:hypothetical protein
MAFDFNNGLRVKTKDVEEVFQCVDDSYRTQLLYEETGKVLITLSDRFGTSRMLLFKRKNGRGRGIRILDPFNEYEAVIWDQNGKFDGMARDERGKRKIGQCAKMFTKALFNGSVDFEVEKTDIPCSQHVPLTEKEIQFLLDLEQNNPILEYSPNVAKRLLTRKGINVYEKFPSYDWSKQTI